MISVGGAKDITRIFVEQMLEPNGVKPGEFDMTFAGATSARFSALQAGAVDAAILTPPFNFHAQTAGFTYLGHTVEYVDMPFAGIGGEHQLGRGQQGHGRKADRGLQRQHGLALRSQEPRRGGGDFDEGQQDQEGGRREGLRLSHRGKYFEPTGKVSKSRLNKLVDALKTLGDIPQDFPVERLFLPGVTQIAN